LTHNSGKSKFLYIQGGFTTLHTLHRRSKNHVFIENNSHYRAVGEGVKGLGTGLHVYRKYALGKNKYVKAKLFFAFAYFYFAFAYFRNK
jgi:hypothetical protein